MAYRQILKALHSSLQQTATQYAVHTCKLSQVSMLVHTHRTVSTVARLSFHRGVQTPWSVQPVLSCFVQAQTRRGISLHSAARNQSSPEERDKSVSRFQSGSPKPSAAQKGQISD